MTTSGPSHTQESVLLISPPWRFPTEPSLGVATLASVLRREGLAVDTLSGTHLFPRSSTDPRLMSAYSMFFFTPHAFPEVSADRCADATVAAFLRGCNLDGLRLPPRSATLEQLGEDEAAIRATVHANVVRAGVCIDRCVQRVLEASYDVVCLSCTFELQLTAALAIAARLRAARPELRIALGGAACFGPAAGELAAAFDTIDAVCYSEGDEVIVPLVKALRGGRPLSEVPGIVWTDEHDVTRRTPPPPLSRELDRLPIPDYHDFVEQHARSEWSDLPLTLFFETSRGCWWGHKHLCTFCGLNTDASVYRRKSAERAVEEICHLHDTYPAAERLQAADNILDMGYLEAVLPRLAEWRLGRERPLRMFWEIKTNLQRAQIQTLAEAGVDIVQPGIESFSDDTLRLLNKGATGQTQIQVLKWLYEHGIQPSYNLLVMNPGESEASYHEMVALAPYLVHLPPPRVLPMELHRFSPYFTDPARHQITNVRPRERYARVFGEGRVDTARLAYVFDFDHPMRSDEALRRAQRRFSERMIEWGRGWRRDMALYVVVGAEVIVADRRSAPLKRHRLSGLGRQLFAAVDRSRARRALLREHPTTAPEVVQCALDTWQARRWVCRDEADRYLGVIPERKDRTFAARTATGTKTTSSSVSPVR